MDLSKTITTGSKLFWTYRRLQHKLSLVLTVIFTNALNEKKCEKRTANYKFEEKLPTSTSKPLTKALHTILISWWHQTCKRSVSRTPLGMRKVVASAIGRPHWHPRIAFHNIFQGLCFWTLHFDCRHKRISKSRTTSTISQCHGCWA